MPSKMRRQVFADIADVGDLFQVGVHLLVAGNRQQFPFNLQCRVILVLIEHLYGIRQQRHTTHHGCFLSWFMNPMYSLLVRCDVLLV
jgi:hypothetical protein